MSPLDLLPLLAAMLITVSGAPTLRIGGSVVFHKNPDHSSPNLLDFALVTSTSTVYETTTETEYVSCYGGEGPQTCPPPEEQTFKRKRRTLRIHVGDESLRQEQGIRMPELFPSPMNVEDGEQLERILTGSLEGVIAKPKIKLWTATTVTDIYTSTVTDTETTETVTTYECLEDTPSPPACPVVRYEYNDEVSNEQSQEYDLQFREEPNESLSNGEQQLEERESSNQEKLFGSLDRNNNNNIVEHPKEHPEQSNSNEEVSDGKDDEHISDLSEDETSDFIAKDGEVNGQHNSNDLGSSLLAQSQAEQSLSLQIDNEELVTLAASTEFRESTDVEKEENIKKLEPVSAIPGTPPSSVIHNAPGGDESRDTAINEPSELSLLGPSEATLGDSIIPLDQEHSELSNSNLPESSSVESEKILSSNLANLQQVDYVESASRPIEPSSFETNISPNEEFLEPSLISPITESPSLESPKSKLIESLERDSFNAQPLSSTGEVIEIYDPSTLEEPLTQDSSEQSLPVSKRPGSELSESSTSESSDTLISDTPQPPILVTARPESETPELSASPSVESLTQDLSEQPSLVSAGPGGEFFESFPSESKELLSQDSSDPELVNIAEPAKESSDSSVLESIGSLNLDSLEPTLIKSAEPATETSELSTFESLKSQEQDSLKEQLVISTESLGDPLASSAIDSKESFGHDSIGESSAIQSETGSESSASSVSESVETIGQDLSEVSLLMDSNPDSKVSGFSILESAESLNHDSSEHPLLIATEPVSKTPESPASDSSESLQQNSFEQTLLVATEPESNTSESPSLEPAESLHHHDSSENPVLITKEPESKTSESSTSESTESTHQDLSEPSPLTLTGPLLEPSDSLTHDPTEAPHPANLQVVENVIMHIPLSALPVEESLNNESVEAQHILFIDASRGLFRSDFEEKANSDSLKPAKSTSATASVISQESSS